MTRHNYGDISSETHSNDKRANEESHPSESIETITARRCTEGEASSEQDSWQDIQENIIEGSTFMFPTSPSVIPVMDNCSYTPRLLSARGSVIMASVRPMLQEVGRRAFMPGLQPGFPRNNHMYSYPKIENRKYPPTTTTPLHEGPLQPLPSKMP
jgi:hypothetical protein